MTVFTRLLRPFSLALVLLAAMFIALPDKTAARVIEQRQYGEWTFERYRGSTDWCGAKTGKPDSGVSVMFRFYRDRVEFSVSNPSWTLAANGKPPEIVFDLGNRRFYGETEPLKTPKAVSGRVQSQSEVLAHSFKIARRMRITLRSGGSIAVDLRSASKAINSALRCQRQHLR